MVDGLWLQKNVAQLWHSYGVCTMDSGCSAAAFESLLTLHELLPMSCMHVVALLGTPGHAPRTGSPAASRASLAARCCSCCAAERNLRLQKNVALAACVSVYAGREQTYPAGLRSLPCRLARSLAPVLPPTFGMPRNAEPACTPLARLKAEK